MQELFTERKWRSNFAVSPGPYGPFLFVLLLDMGLAIFSLGIWCLVSSWKTSGRSFSFYPTVKVAISFISFSGNSCSITLQSLDPIKTHELHGVIQCLHAAGTQNRSHLITFDLQKIHCSVFFRNDHVYSFRYGDERERRKKQIYFKFSCKICVSLANKEAEI